MPSVPPELVQLHDTIDKLTLQVRDQIHATLGDQRFQVLDMALRDKAQHDFGTVAAQ